MARLFERATGWLKERLDATVSVTGDYGRGTHAVDGLKAVPRLPGFDSQEITEAVMLSAESLDFVFTASELVLDSAVITPERNDWFRFIRPDGKVAYYDVLPDATGRCYTPSDHLGTLTRVHMQLNRVEIPPESA